MFKRKLLSMVLLMGMLFGQPVPRVQAAICDHVQFVSDLTVPDGTTLAPGIAFTKTWRLKNIGTCTWTTSYTIVWVGGDAIGAPAPIKLPVSVAPEQMVDISVNLTTPAASGNYKGLWKLSNASGTQFGIGDSANDPFWVSISVVQTSAVIYDFVANAPYAQWKSGAGALPFPGTSGDSRGYSYQVNNPHLEDDSFDSLPGLLTVPQNKYNGYIQATYPEFQIQQGDKLQTLVNCEFGATSCYVTFRIDYLLPSGLQKTLWSWKEAPDKRFYRANIDLSPLAGQKVRFVFMLLSTGFANGDRAIWGSPRIIRAGTTQPPAPPATLTPLPNLTPTPTPITPPPPTIAPTGCDRASFVTDVTVQDGTVFTPGAAFTKTWRLKNTGSCVWTTAYKLVYYGGEQMGAPTVVNLPWGAAFDQTVDISVNMIAPTIAGEYRGYWILANASGQFFGIGTDASKPIWVEIKVSGGALSEMGYDFWANACSAQWKSGAGILPCPGTEGDSKGFIIPVNSTHLEDGTIGPAPSLLMAPESKYNGYIQGYYPTITVQPGDRFNANVGCEYGYTSCYVTFRLDYMTPNGGIFNFWTWREQNNGHSNTVEVNLNPLAGKSVRFILTILATGSATGDRVRWTAPYIRRMGDVSGTLTPAPPPTVTPTNTPITMPGNIQPSPVIRGLKMIDSFNGWAMGNGYILRTNDGGVTWYNVTMPNVSSFSGAFFQTTTRAWILSGNTLYHTIDGGHTWTSNEVPFGDGSMQFLNDANGFVLAGQPSGMQKQESNLYQTTDGGVTWTLKYTNNPLDPNAGTSLPFGGHKAGMTFRDTLRGWVGGDYPVNGFVYLYKTNDSGVTWAPQSLPIPTGYQSAFMGTTAPTFFGVNNAILPVWMTLGPDQRDLFIYVTRDGGTTWTLSTGFAREGWNASFVSVTDGFTWNRNGYLQVTHDSGGSWSQVTSNVNFGDNVPVLDFISTTTGWAILNDFNTGTTTLYRTTDGGVTWTLLISPNQQPLAELSIESISIELQNTSCLMDGDVLGTRVWIKNNGQAAAGAFTVTVNNIQQTVNGLGIGETTTLFFPTSTNLAIAVVDSTNAIPESNEANNTRVEIVSIPTPPPPCATSTPNVPQDFNTFGQNLVNALNARSFDLVKGMMGQSFGFAFWQSQGFSNTPDEAIQQLQNYLGATPLTPNASQDLNALLGGLNPYAIMGLDPNTSKGLFVSGWGLDGKGEAILYTTRLADGSLYWHSVLIAPTGFIPDADPITTHDAFCADTRIATLIEQLRGSVNQSNGDMLSALVSPAHGLDIRLWAYSSPVNFNAYTAKTVFTSTDSYTWGGGPSGTPDVGTFKDIIQPKLLDVLNAPNMETYCDNLTKVYPLANPWPYPNIRYYNLYKPSTTAGFDFRTWLVGIEYVNGQPYVSALVTIVWEP